MRFGVLMQVLFWGTVGVLFEVLVTVVGAIFRDAGGC